MTYIQALFKSGARQKNGNDGARRQALRDLLVRLRDQTYEKVKEFRRDQREQAEPPPADEMDAARSTAEVETHASLIEQAEDRIRLIDAALARVEKSSYGICVQCGAEIPIERLSVIPFAANCVDCQEASDRIRRWGQGGMIPPYDHEWTAPEEMGEPSERTYRLTQPEEELAIHYGAPFGPENEREEQGERPPEPRRRGRPRKRRLAS
jgi:RNA polymerase-binding transcription factor